MGFFWWIPFGKVPEVTAEELDALRKEGNAQILDVRTGLEYNASHVPGAVHTPVTDFSSHLAGLQLDKSRPVVAICLSAHRSIPAVRTLQKHGFRHACQLKGGMLSWWHAKLPVISDGSVDIRAASKMQKACDTPQAGAAQSSCTTGPAPTQATTSAPDVLTPAPTPVPTAAPTATSPVADATGAGETGKANP
jgi:rhodanese-related sulfurtransferase